MLPRYVNSAAVFDGEVREAIISLKYRNQRRHAASLGALLASQITVHHRGEVPFDVVTWAPTTFRHRRERGIDHAELIAHRVAQDLHLPLKSLLRRVTQTTQTHHSRRERLLGPVFRAREVDKSQRILVVDDVTTTGATLHAARRAFRSNRAELVECWAVAATPSR